ncbi:hypothetical protein LF1_58750 [Rubripirellula obstinata]|uniref:Uncharacterized protein n=1 Tax=Rubripirellula obstinata TaxID=406547 RepID=A0A5B1CA16_9BACT|nr:hypothetical protein LF1_58750 [Rubripirellula obstinata]
MHRSVGRTLSSLLARQIPHLGDAYRYPTQLRTFAAFLAPCGAHPMLDLHRFSPLLEQHRNADCPAGHQPTPYCNARTTPMSRMHCVAPTNACIRALDLLPLTETCLTNGTLLRFELGDCHLRGRSPR